MIVFDEVYLSNLSTYWRIKQFVERNKHNKIAIATGDAKQLRPVQELTNTQNHEAYTNTIISNICEFHINLKECKRPNTQEDKDKLPTLDQQEGCTEMRVQVRFKPQRPDVCSLYCASEGHLLYWCTDVHGSAAVDDND